MGTSCNTRIRFAFVDTPTTGVYWTQSHTSKGIPPMTPLTAGLFVFFMRVIDMSLDTLRLLFVMRGWKYQAGALGAVQATVFILAVSTVLQGPLNVWTVVGYAAGFGIGVIIGMVAEERLALGYIMFRIYSSTHG